MTDQEQAQTNGEPVMDAEAAVRLRGDLQRVMRLSRKAIGFASACGLAVVGGALKYALQPQARKGAGEPYNTEGVTVADNTLLARRRTTGLCPSSGRRCLASKRQSSGCIQSCG